MGKPMFHSHRYVTIEWVGLILPTLTAEWSASLEQPCWKVMVTPLNLFHPRIIWWWTAAHLNHHTLQSNPHLHKSSSVPNSLGPAWHIITSGMEPVTTIDLSQAMHSQYLIIPGLVVTNRWLAIAGWQLLWWLTFLVSDIEIRHNHCRSPSTWNLRDRFRNCWTMTPYSPHNNPMNLA